MLIVGLTGGIATGKSTATAYLRGLGTPVIDMDEVARVVVEPGRPALAAIGRQFGQSVLQPDGTLNRAELGKRIFTDSAQRRTLNRLMQRPILLELLGQLCACFVAGHGIVVVDAPLLYEAGLQTLVSKVLVVAAPEGEQLQRLMARDSLSAEDARARVDSQMPLAKKVARADYIVDNTSTREAAQASLLAAWKQITAGSALQPTSRPWARLPRARNLAVSVALWFVLAWFRLTGRASALPQPAALY
ncbi:dephospho-CoA kinase-domain-containing protein [Pavlovales sp. CCMP2436]|nr:dephospho-CoA kinase-domain-containing protein [Pavlovales sp. CCMP2436]|mmetsp:Transcript_5096/g.13222  ORF Transcript_5096/g.13222 Transcript_5096/m.13222 type:complete len:247 (+) Transcript_5096:91-831(+)